MTLDAKANSSNSFPPAKTKQKTYIVVFISIAAVVSFSVFLVWPVTQDIKKYSEELAVQKKNFSVSLEEAQNTQDDRKFYEDGKEALGEVNALFVNAELPIDLIKFLEDNAASVNLAISIAPGIIDDKEEKQWPALAFHLSIQGSFPNLLKFIAKMESGPYLIDTVSLDVKKLIEEKKIAGGVSSGDVSAIIVIKALTKK